MRAAIKNLEPGKTVQGGSTITMQLVRNLYLRSRTERDLQAQDQGGQARRGARGASARRSWILTSYLNSVPYGTVGGRTAVGIEAAARMFFDKPARSLTLKEAALLAGLPQAPSHYNPFTQRAPTPRRAATRSCSAWPSRR